MKNIFLFILILNYCVATHAQVDTMMFIPKKPLGMAEGKYARYVGMIKKGFQNKNNKEISQSKKSRYLNNIAASYLNLEVDSKIVFYWLNRAAEEDPYTQCESILGWLTTLEVYEKCDSIEWKKICNYCRDYLNSEEAQEIKRKKEEEKRKELANLDKKLVQEIEAIAIADQKYRQKITDAEKKYGEKSTQVDSLWTLQNHLDSVNLIKVEKFISKYGYPIRKMVGKDYRFIAFSVIQHSTTEKMLYYLPLFIELAERKELSKNIVTLVIDRIHWQKFGTQLYGTQSSSKPIPIYKEEERNSRLEKLAQGKLELGQITFPNYMIIDVGQSCKIMYP